MLCPSDELLADIMNSHDFERWKWISLLINFSFFFFFFSNAMYVEKNIALMKSNKYNEP